MYATPRWESRAAPPASQTPPHELAAASSISAGDGIPPPSRSRLLCREHAGKSEDDCVHELIVHNDEAGVEPIHAYQHRPKAAELLTSESPPPSGIDVSLPAQAKQAHGNRQVERKTDGPVLHKNLQKGVVRSIGHRAVPFHASRNLCRHLVEAPTQDGLFASHIPGGAVDGHSKIDGLLFPRAIEQRTLALGCCQGCQQTQRSQGEQSDAGFTQNSAPV